MAENNYVSSTIPQREAYETTSTLDQHILSYSPRLTAPKKPSNFFTRAGAILGLAGMLTSQAPPISNAYAQQPQTVLQIDSIRGPFHDPQLTGILAPNFDGDNNPNNDFGYLALKAAGFRNGEREGTFRMQPGTKVIRFFRPSSQAENEMRRMGLDLADYASIIMEITNAYAAQTNGQISFNSPIFDPQVLTNGRPISQGGQVNPNEFTIGIFAEGEGPFTGRASTFSAVNRSFVNDGIINGGTGLYNATRLDDIGVRTVAAEEVAEGRFFNSTNLEKFSPVLNPGTVLVYSAIPPGLNNSPIPTQIDLEVTRLIYAFPPNTTLERITTSTNNLQPVEVVTTSTIPPTQ